MSSSQRPLPINIHKTHNRQTSMPLVGFEPTISAGNRQQTYALDRATTGNGKIMDRKVKWSRYRFGVAQRVGRVIALLFPDRGTRRGWVVSSTPRPHFVPAKEPVPIVQEAGWDPGPVWSGGKSRPHRHSIPDHPALSRHTDWTTRPTDNGHIYVKFRAMLRHKYNYQ